MRVYITAGGYDAMPPEELDEMLRYLKGLADATRLRLLGLLATEERSVEELAALLRVKAPTVSHHLAKLKDLDLVRMRAEGNTHYYRLNEHGLGRMNALLAAPEQVAALAGGLPEDAWERKVLGEYFTKNGRLREMPMQRKKRAVVMRWLAEQFAWGRTYTEKEVNELLGRYHEDVAYLRRELVGMNLLQREHGIYWQTEAGSEPHGKA